MPIVINRKGFGRNRKGHYETCNIGRKPKLTERQPKEPKETERSYFCQNEVFRPKYNKNFVPKEGQFRPKQRISAEMLIFVEIFRRLPQNFQRKAEIRPFRLTTSPQYAFFQNINSLFVRKS